MSLGGSNWGTTGFCEVDLTRQGFTGWLDFPTAAKGENFPRIGGIYVVHYDGPHPPSFEKVSSGGWFKGRDPSVSHEALLANWVEGASVVYIGKADQLRRRIRQFAEFGRGRPKGHWGGRLIWHLSTASLRIAWAETPDRAPIDAEANLIGCFRSAYGKPPFANNPHLLGR